MAATASKKKTKAASKTSDRVGRGTRWTDEQVSILMDAVKGAGTAKEGFEQAAKQLGKNVGTVQQKYYNLQKKLTGGGRRRAAGAPRTTTATASTARAPRGAALPTATELRAITIDELVGLAQRVKAEVDRRKQEIDAAEKLFK